MLGPQPPSTLVVMESEERASTRPSYGVSSMLCDPSNEIVKNGLGFTGMHFPQQRFDYVAIKGLPLNLKDRSLQRSAYLEAIPPPVHGCIQLHRLKEGQDLAHLLVLYTRFGAKAIIFVNTRDGYELQPDLTSTLSVIKGSSYKYCCVLISRSDGERLIDYTNDFKGVFCEINSGSCSDDELLIVKDYHTSKLEKHSRSVQGLFDYEVPSFQGDYGRLVQTITDIIEQELVISQDNFSFVMETCEKMENLHMKWRIIFNMDKVLHLLLQPSRFGMLFQHDFLFCVTIVHRVCSSSHGLFCNKELLKKFCTICIEGLCETQPKTLLSSLQAFKKGGAFEVILKDKHVSVFDVLGQSFSDICQLWLKYKKEPTIPSKYWDIAMLCMSFSQSLFTHPVTSTLWKEHIEKNSQRMTFEKDDSHHLRKGLMYMTHLKVPQSKAFTLNHFADFLCSGPIRRFKCIEMLVILFAEFNINFRKSHLEYFLSKTRLTYEKYYNSERFSYAAISQLGGMFGAFQEGWIFILHASQIFMKRECLDSLRENIYKWLSTLLMMINFTDIDAARCVTLVVASLPDVPDSFVTYITTELNSRFVECCHKLPIETFQPVFFAAKIWKPMILETYLQSYIPQPDIIVCNSVWQELLLSATDSSLGNSKIMLQLIEKIAMQYANSNRTDEFFPHMMKLKTPQMFQSSTGSDSKSYTTDFVMLLQKYITMWTLTKEQLLQYIEECTKCEETNSFMTLVVSAVLKEITSDLKVLQGDTNTINSQIKNLLVMSVTMLCQNVSWFSSQSPHEEFCWEVVAVCSSKIPVTADNFEWIFAFEFVVSQLGQLFNSYVLVSQLQITDVILSRKMPEEVANCSCDNVVEYFNWVKKAQRVLTIWQDKFQSDEANFDDILIYASHLFLINKLGKSVCACSTLKDSQSIQNSKNLFKRFFSLLNSYLLKYIPGHPEANWITLPELFDYYNVRLPTQVKEFITNHILFPGEEKQLATQLLDNNILIDASLFQLGDRISLQLTKAVTLRHLQDINALLDNMDLKQIDLLVYFHLQQSEIFRKYLWTYLINIPKTDAGALSSVSSYMYQPKLSLQPTQSSFTVAMLGRALESFDEVIHRLANGTSAYAEIVFNEAFKHDHGSLNIEREFELFTEYAQRAQLTHFKDMASVQSMLELFQFTHHIKSLHIMCQQYQLKKCLADPSFQKLMEIIDELSFDQARASLTLENVTKKLNFIKLTLCLKGDANSCCSFLKLFAVVKSCAVFHPLIQTKELGVRNKLLEFLQRQQICPAMQIERLTIGEKWPELLQRQCQVITAQLSHLQTAVVDFVTPFINQEHSFEYLVSQIEQMELSHALKHLEIVHKSFSSVQQWVSGAEEELEGKNLGELQQHEQTLASLEDKESEAACLKERNALLQKQNSCLHKLLDELLDTSKINKHSITRQDEGETTKEVTHLKETLANLQKQKLGLEECKLNHIQKSSGLQREIAPLQADNTHAVGMNSNYVAEVVRLQNDIADLQELNAHRVAEITRLEREVVCLQEDKWQLQLKVDINFWLVNSHEINFTGEVLGEGAWGKVTVGSFRGQKVAIKQLHTAIKSDFFNKLFRREISMMAKVRHPNLLLFIAAVLDPSFAPIIITELLDTSLRHAYESNQLTDKCTMISVLKDVAAALNYLHLQRDPIIHRDVSSTNVLLLALPDKCWRAKLSDFGSANLARCSTTPAPGAAVYSAPEAFIEGKQSPKIDVFSYGKLFCEVCTSTFPDPDAFPLMLQSMAREWSNIYQTILDCMEHDPAKRPTMSSIVNKLITNTVC